MGCRHTLDNKGSEMKLTPQECLDLISGATSEDQLFERVRIMAGRLGFEYCAYGVQMPLPVSRPRIEIFNNYPEQWQERYARQRYLSIDPTVRHGLRSMMPLVWTPELFSTASQLWDEAKEHGLRHGWAQAARDPMGAVGMLTLARGEQSLSNAELKENEPMMLFLAQAAHAGMTRLLIPRLAPEAGVQITIREREVLLWTAEGKTAYEISCILGVSERTVNFHINNAVAKLSAANKTQAAVKASALGMLL